jgi:YbbR domain-containing protein
MKRQRHEAKVTKYLHWKKIRKILTSKSFLGSIFFAFAMWVYTSLNAEYKTFVDVPLKIKLPKNVAIETPLPSKISIKVKGSGWAIFYLDFFSTSADCLINLSDKPLSEGSYQITRSEIIKGVEYFLNVEAIDVLPEVLEITTGLIAQRTVPVKSNISLNLKDGFSNVGNIVLSPDSISISGNKKVIDNISHWETVPTTINKVFEPGTITVSLKDTLNTIVTLSQNYINANYDVEQSADLTVYDIPVNIKGSNNLPKNHKLEPNRICITLSGGVEQLANFDPGQIESYIDLKDILQDSTGIIIPKVKIGNKNIKLNSINPPYIFHKRYINSIREAGLQSAG